MEIPPVPAPAGEREIPVTMQRLMAAPEALRLELLPLGNGPLAVAADAHGVIGLDPVGDVVFIVGVPEVEPGTAAAISDELDHIARMSTSDLEHLTGASPGDLGDRHRKRFATGAATRFNADQSVVVVTSTQPTERAWKELVIELGNRLKAVHLESGGTLSPLQPPQALRRSSAQTDRRGASWLALGAVLLGVGVLLLGLARLLLFDDEPPANSVDSPIRTVAPAASADATHGNWIGQRRAVVTSQGRIILVYRTGSGLQLVTDQSNRGRTWRSPLTVTEIAPSSFAVANDGRDDLHVALVDNGTPRLISLHQSAEGWSSSEPLDLADEPMTSSVIDTSWDVAADVGYVVWAQPADDGGEELRWAAVEAGREQPEITAEGSLTRAPEGIPILANVASLPDSTMLVTYRAADGWFSQLGRLDPTTGVVEWQPEERVPAEGGVGAAALVADPSGTAHLLLRNDAGPRLEYFRRSPARGWSAPEPVAEAAAIEDIDFPALAVDTGSRLVYAFFQTRADGGLTQVQVAFRDPADAWVGPYDVAPPTIAPEGSAFPTSTGMAAGEPLVFWTTGGGSPTVQSARVVAP